MIDFTQLQAICKSAPEARLILFVGVGKIGSGSFGSDMIFPKPVTLPARASDQNRDHHACNKVRIHASITCLARPR